MKLIRTVFVYFFKILAVLSAIFVFLNLDNIAKIIDSNDDNYRSQIDNMINTTLLNDNSNSNINEMPSDSVAPISASVLRIVDGDTIIVNFNDGSRSEVRVRMIGINTLESVHPDASKNEEAGVLASDYTKEQLPEGATIYLTYDIETTDQYERDLCYIWQFPNNYNLTTFNPDDVSTAINYMYNAKLIMSGYADAKAYEPNIKYKTLFEELQNIRQNNLN